jgi:hypothetical protein
MAIVLIELDPQHSGMTRAPIEDDAGMFAQVAKRLADNLSSVRRS